MSRRALSACLALLILAGIAAADPDETLLLREPSISATQVVFRYAEDLWIVSREGGTASRLTSHAGDESSPHFSPDGTLIAFSAEYDGNTDIYVVAAEGGQPQRLTYHPDGDFVRGWAPDGKRVLLTSYRDTPHWYGRFYTVAIDGTPPTRLIVPRGEMVSYSPDGGRIAYTQLRGAHYTWRRYRGGRTPSIWIFDLESHDAEEIPDVNANDTIPMWIGDTIYFVSDRNRTMNLFAYDPGTSEIDQLTFHDDFDIRSASANRQDIVYEQGGRIHVFDTETRQGRAISVRVVSDLPHLRARYRDVSDSIRSWSLSPSGARAVFGARGEVFTVPAKKGDIRNITRTPAVHERYPSWSPDGNQIAYFSDATGEYQLMLRDQKGVDEPRAIALGEPSFFFSPRWSPDGAKIAYTDKHLRLYILDVESGESSLVDTEPYARYGSDAQYSFDPEWSPDSRWLAYVRRLDNFLPTIFVYDVDEGTPHQITDGRSDATSPTFSLDGKYLFFRASTSLGLSVGWHDMSSYERPVQSNLYLVVLARGEPSPFAPESDEEEQEDDSDAEGEADADAEEAEEQDQEVADGEPDDSTDEDDDATDDEDSDHTEVVIDFDRIDQRIIAMPLPAGEYNSLQAADGKLFYRGADSELRRYDMKEREDESFLKDVHGYVLTYDGKKLLYRRDSTYAIVETEGSPKPDDGTLDLGEMEAYVDPRGEWEQMFDEAWRLERDFFYDADMHGADWPAVRERYRPFLPHVGHRDDLNYLLAMVASELVVSHMGVGGGDTARPRGVAVGLLGADLEAADGYYRVAHIYSGENWNPDLRAPLTEPGVDVSEGDYILAVNGRPATSDRSIYGLFEKTADRQTVLLVNGRPEQDEARSVTVVPVSSDRGLRRRGWIEDNRRTVDRLTGGRVAYVYMPNTAGAGYTSFNRDYFAHLDREAVIIDERFNGGGSLADYVVDLMARTPLAYPTPRDGKPFATPNTTIAGPKVMLINEYAGSG